MNDSAPTDDTTRRDGDELIIVERREPPPSQVNDTLVLGFAIAAALGAATFAVTLALDGPLPLYGGALALGLLCLGIAIRRYFTDRYPDVVAAEPRAIPAADDDEPVALVEPIARRPFLTRALIAAAGVFGLAALVPVSSLGPAPGDALRTTRWRRGTRLVTSDGEPIRPGDVAFGGINTAWPQGAIGHERSAVLVLRLSTEAQPPTNLDWVVDGNLVAYSKICTHAGCPVALFRERDNVLFCPCHQSTFDASQGAQPTFGPAARNLPQLPLGVEDGYLVALGDFTEQVGPAFG
ncbi:MAG TPA: ubiquinol-cytochrome c reductase iron-sulfur subunit [Egibacteraceae bacterium]